MAHATERNPAVHADETVCPNHKDMLRASTFQWAFGILIGAVLAVGGMLRAGVASSDRVDAAEKQILDQERAAREARAEWRAELASFRSEMRESFKDLRQEIRRAP